LIIPYAGNFNSGNYQDILVGSPREKTSEIKDGRVYLYLAGEHMVTGCSAYFNEYFG